MKRYGRRLIIFSIIIYALAFGGLMLYSFFSFEEKHLLVSFRSDWLMTETLIRLAGLLIPLQATAVVLAYGTEGKDRQNDLSLPDPFYRIIKPAMLFFIVVTLLFTLLSEWVIPSSHKKQQELLYTTTVARNLLEQANAAKAEGNYREAYDYLEEYLELDPGNKDQLKAQEEIMDNIIADRQSEKTEPEAPAEKEERIRPAMTAEEFIREAQRFFDEGDYFSAHYYATLAYRADPSRTDADELAKRSWRLINELAPTPEEVEQYTLHHDKKRGLEALTAGRPLEAYYLFTRLAKDYPLDPDITTYLEQSRRAVKDISFFHDELEKTTRFPGERHLVFLNSPEEDTGEEDRREEDRREIVFVDTLKNIREGYYLFDIEVLSFDIGGTIHYHYKAPYGKIIDDRLVTLCIDREREEDYYDAQYIAGSRPEAERNVLPLHLSPDMMARFSAEKGFLSRLSLPDLWDLGKVYTDHGMRRETVDIEVASRLMRPFAFLLFSFLALAVSWALRPLSNRPGFFSYPLILLVPVVAYGLLMLYYYAARLLNGFLLIWLGFGATLAAIVIVQGFFLAGVFIYLAGQSTE